MGFLKSVTVGILALSQFGNAIPTNYTNPTLEARKLYALDGGQEPSLTKRALFNVDGILDDNRKEVLRQGLKDAVEVASVVLDKMGKEKHKNKISAWFGDVENEDYEGKVRDVFKNFVGENHDHEGANVLGQLIVFPDDYWYVEERGQNFCDVVKPDGSTGTAYYMPRDKKYYGMHYCDKFFRRLNLKDYTEQYLRDNCAGMPDHIDTNHISRVFQGANVLHEVMHFPLVGKAGTSKQIGDAVYNAYNCYTLKTTPDALNQKGKPKRTIDNADSYVYYAMHIYLEEKCDRAFGYPQSMVDN
ncbi:uncharacterized protein BKCO1_7500029 [Diplodia corticola]|uniref:Lysine-specific metallo-endopeptidase domain-containing protein n=1 Tax=Diplodia corticola TaxID=236234 RepID=A0A1J9QL93_9PEZI|nr:uncharacterized protein BKCO1_7500029 [Diplodia corticola]OJD29662.1 hypothetical protein BKCO1_7500029 [Diplodia corticola]